jgi:hypothetical protein
MGAQSLCVARRVPHTPKSPAGALHNLLTCLPLEVRRACIQAGPVFGCVQRAPCIHAHARAPLNSNSTCSVPHQPTSQVEDVADTGELQPGRHSSGVSERSNGAERDRRARSRTHDSASRRGGEPGGRTPSRSRDLVVETAPVRSGNASGRRGERGDSRPREPERREADVRGGVPDRYRRDAGPPADVRRRGSRGAVASEPRRGHEDRPYRRGDDDRPPYVRGNEPRHGGERGAVPTRRGARDAGPERRGTERRGDERGGAGGRPYDRRGAGGRGDERGGPSGRPDERRGTGGRGDERGGWSDDRSGAASRAGAGGMRGERESGTGKRGRQDGHDSADEGPAPEELLAEHEAALTAEEREVRPRAPATLQLMSSCTRCCCYRCIAGPFHGPMLPDNKLRIAPLVRLCTSVPLQDCTPLSQRYVYRRKRLRSGAGAAPSLPPRSRPLHNLLRAPAWLPPMGRQLAHRLTAHTDQPAQMAHLRRHRSAA